MPAQTSWYLRVPEIAAQLRAPAAPPFLDRPAIESLFRLRRRQAIRGSLTKRNIEYAKAKAWFSLEAFVRTVAPRARAGIHFFDSDVRQ